MGSRKTGHTSLSCYYIVINLPDLVTCQPFHLNVGAASQNLHIISILVYLLHSRICNSGAMLGRLRLVSMFFLGGKLPISDFSPLFLECFFF